MSKIVVNGQEVGETGAVGPFEFLSTLQESEIVRFLQVKFSDGADEVSVYYQEPTAGATFMLPGLKYKIGRDANLWSKLDFISLMLALFLGTAVRGDTRESYYTVYRPAHAGKSSILEKPAGGAFSIRTLIMCLGAAVNGVFDI